MIKLKRVIKSGLTNFWRNSAVAMASILVLTTTLFVVGALILGSIFLESTLTGIKDRVDISVTLEPAINLTLVEDLKLELEALPEVKTVIYTSPDEELATFKERHSDNPLLMQSLEEVDNPFGARLAILATDPSQYDAVTTFLNNYDQRSTAGGSNFGVIDQISYKKDVVDKLLAIIDTSETIGLTISVLLILLSILVTFNTIALTIYISREEISVMRLVGADNPYIRGPFIVEGITAGVIASVISMFLLYPATLWIRSVTAGVYGGIDLVSYYVSHFPVIFVILLVSGIILGTVSSVLAIGRYLKV